MLFSILLALIQTNQPAHEEIVIHHRKVAQFMRSGWLLVTQFQVAPGNIKVSTDTAKNAIVLDGPPGILRAIRDAITFFDVAPRIIKLTLQSSAPQYGLGYESSALIENISIWQIMPRLNDDGTITLQVGANESGITMKAWDRIKDGGWTHLSFSGGKLQPQRDAKTDLDLLIRAQVQEAPQPSKLP